MLQTTLYLICSDVLAIFNKMIESGKCQLSNYITNDSNDICSSENSVHFFWISAHVVVSGEMRASWPSWKTTIASCWHQLAILYTAYIRVKRCWTEKSRIIISTTLYKIINFKKHFVIHRSSLAVGKIENRKSYPSNAPYENRYLVSFVEHIQMESSKTAKKTSKNYSLFSRQSKLFYII